MIVELIRRAASDELMVMIGHNDMGIMRFPKNSAFCVSEVSEGSVVLSCNGMKCAGSRCELFVTTREITYGETAQSVKKLADTLSTATEPTTKQSLLLALEAVAPVGLAGTAFYQVLRAVRAHVGSTARYDDLTLLLCGVTE